MKLLSTLFSIVTLVAVFIAGWLAATDKNRNELYKRKLDAYDELLDNVQFLVILLISSKFGKIDDNDLVNARISLYQKRLSKILYISDDVQKEVMYLFSSDAESPEKLFAIISNIAKLSAKDLNIKNHTFMSNLAAGEIDALVKKYNKNNLKKIDENT